MKAQPRPVALSGCSHQRAIALLKSFTWEEAERVDQGALESGLTQSVGATESIITIDRSSECHG